MNKKRYDIVQLNSDSRCILLETYSSLSDMHLFKKICIDNNSLTLKKINENKVSGNKKSVKARNLLPISEKV